jgi:type I restriction enzyme S subunit
MKSILLGDLIELKYGKSLRKDFRSEGVVPVFGSNGQVDTHNESLVNYPTIIIGRKGSIGEVHLARTPCWPIDTTYFVKAIGDHEYDISWLYLLLRTLRLQNLNRSAAIPGLNREDVYRIKVALPPINEQIRIAHLLGKVEGLIVQRKQFLQHLDEFVKSSFLDLFGDPVRNEKGWEKTHLSKLLVNIESGKSPKCEARPASDDEWGVLKLGAITKCIYDERENKALPVNVRPSIRDEVKAGDLLFSRKNTYQLVAACAYVFETRPKLLMPDLIFRLVFRSDAGVNPIYMWKLLTAESQRKAIQSLAAGAAGSMPNISKANLKEVKIPIPPLPLQERFAAIVNKAESLKSSYQQSLTDLEALYGALSQQAFNGKLDLAKVQLPPMLIQEEQTVARSPLPVQTAAPAIDLSDSGLLLATLENSNNLNGLLQEWLEAYHAHLGADAFSIARFMAAAQRRIVEMFPDSDVELGTDTYEYIKRWVFEALENGRLTQSQNITGVDINGKPISGNLIEIKSGVQS